MSIKLLTYATNNLILDIEINDSFYEEEKTLPRPKKCRKVCQMPQTKEFRPVGDFPDNFVVILSVDEYEAIRLIDKQGFSQEECSTYMQVARTTVQMIYNSARKKLPMLWWMHFLFASRGAIIGFATEQKNIVAAAVAENIGAVISIKC